MVVKVAEWTRPVTTKGHARGYISRCEVQKLSQRQPAVHIRERPLHLYILRTWDGMSNNGAPDCVVRARPGPVHGGNTRARGSSGQRRG